MNRKLSANKALTKLAVSKGITHWDALIDYIKQLPYGRTSNREDLSLVFKEQQGTCSSKHALLAAVAKENALNEVQLLLVMYRMDGINTPKVGPTLSQYKLSYIPEAHTVLQVGDTIVDATYPTASYKAIEAAILYTEVITPSQIIDYKAQTHQDYLKAWMLAQKISVSFEELWQIREKCIAALSQ